jgi:hypothetical protein
VSNLNRTQFGEYDIQYVGGAHNMHRVRAYKDGETVGNLSWDSRMIHNVEVNAYHRRKGVATAMYDFARNLNSEQIPAIQHSPERTKEGEKWAKTTEGYTKPSYIMTQREYWGLD